MDVYICDIPKCVEYVRRVAKRVFTTAFIFVLLVGWLIDWLVGWLKMDNSIFYIVLIKKIDRIYFVGIK
jgi:hypothetical protein